MSRPTDLHYRSPKQKTPEYYDTNHTSTGVILDPLLQKTKNYDSQQSFNSKQKRFYQYDTWAKNTSVFLGPGSYQDQEVYKNLVAQPCTVKYKFEEAQKEQSRNCYTVINGSLIQYVKEYDKDLRNQNNNQNINNNDNISKISLNSLFPNRKQNVMNNIKIMRQQSKQSQQPFKKDYKASQSFYSENSQTQDGMNRPSTSYSLSRGQRSALSQSRNHTNNISKLMDSFQTPTSNQKLQFESNSLMYRTNMRGSEQISVGQNGRLHSVQYPYRSKLNQSMTQNHIKDPQILYGSFDTQNPQNNIILAEGQQQIRAATSMGTRNKNMIFKKNSKVSQKQIIDLKKSVTLLQAYGEYDRFLQMSKQYMKEKGIVIKKTLRKKKKKTSQQLLQQIPEPSQQNFPVKQNDLHGENYKEINQILEEKLQVTDDFNIQNQENNLQQ